MESRLKFRRLAKNDSFGFWGFFLSIDVLIFLNRKKPQLFIVKKSEVILEY